LIHHSVGGRSYTLRERLSEQADFEVIEEDYPDRIPFQAMDDKMDMVIAPMYYSNENDHADYESAAAFFSEVKEKWGDNLALVGLAPAGAISDETIARYGFPPGIKIMDLEGMSYSEMVENIKTKFDEKPVHEAIAHGEEAVRTLLQQGISRGGWDMLCTLVKDRPLLNKRLEATRKIFNAVSVLGITNPSSIEWCINTAFLDARIGGITVSEVASARMADALAVEDYEGSVIFRNFIRAYEEKLKSTPGMSGR